MDFKDVATLALMGGALYSLASRPTIKNSGTLSQGAPMNKSAEGAAMPSAQATQPSTTPCSKPAGMYLSSSLLPRETEAIEDEAYAPLPSALLSGKAFLSSGVNILGEVTVSRNSWQGIREEVPVSVQGPVSVWQNSSWAPTAVHPTAGSQTQYQTLGESPSHLPAVKQSM